MFPGLICDKEHVHLIHTHTHTHTESSTHNADPELGGWVGEAELDDVVLGSGQQCLRLVLVLKHRLLAAVLLLLPRQRLLLLRLLQQSTDHPSASKQKTHLSDNYIPAMVNTTRSSVLFKAGKHIFLVSFLERSTTPADDQLYSQLEKKYFQFSK